MRPRSKSKLPSVLEEVDILAAPMEFEHKHLVLLHFHRLRGILDESDEDAIGGYTTKQAAREQLARMTLIFRDYESKVRNGEIDEVVESMVADVVDASFALGGRRGTYEQPILASSLLMGREQEVAALMQELDAGNVDDVIELWNAPPKAEKVLPDITASKKNIGAEVDWTASLVRSKSENNIAYYRRPNITIKDRPKFTRGLSRRNIRDLVFAWPPKTAERVSFAHRQRMVCDGEWDESVWSSLSP